MALARQVKPLHELLVEQGGLTPEQVQHAQAQAAKSGQALKRVVVQQGLVSEQELAGILAA